MCVVNLTTAFAQSLCGYTSGMKSQSNAVLLKTLNTGSVILQFTVVTLQLIRATRAMSFANSAIDLNQNYAFSFRRHTTEGCRHSNWLLLNRVIAYYHKDNRS